MKEQAVSTKWKPGESGNPAERPVGSRNKLSEAVPQDIAEDWAIGGAEAVARVRMTDPATYFRVVASILPKDVLSVVDNTTMGGLSADDRGAAPAVGRHPGRGFCRRPSRGVRAN